MSQWKKAENVSLNVRQIGQSGTAASEKRKSISRRSRWLRPESRHSFSSVRGAPLVGIGMAALEHRNEINALSFNWCNAAPQCQQRYLLGVVFYLHLRGHGLFQWLNKQGSFTIYSV